MGFSKNEKNDNNGFPYNLMLKNIPFYIHTNGTAGEYWLHRQQDYPAQTQAETLVYLQERPD